MMLELILLLVFIGGILFFSRLTTDNAVSISNILGTSYSVVGFIMVAISTSLPELFVAIESAWLESGAIAVSNILGSNIANIALVFGTVGVIYGFKVSNAELKNNSVFLLLISALPLYFIVAESISWIAGLILIGLFCVYIYYLIKSEVKPPGMVRFYSKMRKRRPWGLKKWRIMLKKSALFSVGIGGTILCANQIVSNSLYLIEALMIPPAFIGATIIAIGTSLPELLVNLQAMKRGYKSMAFGGIIGSCVTNLTLVLGASALIGGTIVMNAYMPIIAILLLINLIMMHT